MDNFPNNAESSKPFLRESLGKLAWLKNKYLLVGVFFIVWMLFFDLKDIPSVFNRWTKLKERQRTERHLNNLIADTHKEQDLLKTNVQTIEKYARENFLMKKDNEDLFIVKTPSESN